MTRCQLSDLDVEQCACRLHATTAAEPHRRILYGMPLMPVRAPIRAVKPRPVILTDPVSVGVLDTTAAIARQIQLSAGEIITMWPHLTAPIPAIRTDPHITGTGVLAADDSPRSDDLPRIDSLTDLRSEIGSEIAFWAKVTIEERPVTDVALSAHDVVGMARFLRDQATWLSGHAVGDECADDLRRLARTMHRVIVGTPHRDRAGAQHLHEPVVLIPTAQLVRELPLYGRGYDYTEGHIRVMLHRGEIASSGLDDTGDRLWDLWAVLYALGKRDTTRTA